MNEVLWKPVLIACLRGEVPEKLKELYNFPIRNEIPWHLFPLWAQPNCITEGGHEG